MADFLLELRCEEIPARMQAKARADLERLFVEQVAAAGLQAGRIVTHATPRRLALIATGLPLATQAVREELKGPPADAPDAAIDGFLRKAGLARDALETREVKGRATLFAVIERPGRATADVLAAAIPAIVRAFPWPKSMRWGAASLSSESPRWVRPLQGIVAILGQDLVPCEVAGVASSFATVGHRFHSPRAITIGGAHDYAEKLRLAHVIVDQDERAAIIRDRATALAADAGLTLIEDAGLVAENAGLTEWPVPLLGRFDPAFLDVPPEVIQLTARVNQKYFVCQGGDGVGASDGPQPSESTTGGRDLAPTLANAFICVANIDARDGGERIVAGNEKVLAARLSDARFFYDTDLKVPLEEQAKKLEKIVFHEKLGTVADKVERVARLARWLVEQGIVKGADPAHAERAARLAKADLVTGMVGEFPELQGLIGGYYARAQGEPTEVWEAVRDHYKPVGQGDEVPTAPVTVAVSLADKLDTIAAFFVIDEKPTGSKDPFALRRAAIAVVATIMVGKLRLSLTMPMALAAAQASIVSRSTDVRSLAHGLNQITLAITGEHESVFAAVVAANQTYQSEKSRIAADSTPAVTTAILAFFADRLKVQQREAGVRHDLIDAVFALGGEDDLVRLLARVHALQAFVTTSEGANLLAGYKRAANILKKEGWQDAAASSAPTPSPSLADMADQTAPFGEEPARLPGERRVIEADLANGHIPQTGEEDPLAEGAGQGDAGMTGGGEGDAAPATGAVPAPAREPAEAALIAALDAAEPRAAAAIAAEDFTAAMAALATLREPVDAFFERVTVNDADPAKRAARLSLLARMRAAIHRVADFSRIEG